MRDLLTGFTIVGIFILLALVFLFIATLISAIVPSLTVLESCGCLVLFILFCFMCWLIGNFVNKL